MIWAELGNDTIIGSFSNIYDGTYIVEKDTTLVSYGQHYSWVDYKNRLKLYFDRGKYPWISLEGQITPEGIIYGEIIYQDTTMPINTKIEGSPEEFVLHFNPDTIQNYIFTIHFNQK